MYESVIRKIQCSNCGEILAAQVSLTEFVIYSDQDLLLASVPATISCSHCDALNHLRRTSDLIWSVDIISDAERREKTLRLGDGVTELLEKTTYFEKQDMLSELMKFVKEQRGED